MGKIPARRVRSTYADIIELNLPWRILWSKVDGSFLGVECDIPKSATRYQRTIIHKFLADISIVYQTLDEWAKELKQQTPIPQSFIQAFEDDGEAV